MKRFTFIIAAIAGICVALGSCSSGQYTATPNNDLSKVPNPIYYKIGMSADINGTSWNATPDPIAHKISVGGTNTLAITGAYGMDSTAGYQAIALTISNYHGNGTYPLNTAGIANYIYDSLSAAPVAVPSLGGLITISSDDGLYVQGKFSFTAKNFTITNGTFYAIYQ